jgi:hypothetical protein
LKEASSDANSTNNQRSTRHGKLDAPLARLSHDG